MSIETSAEVIYRVAMQISGAAIRSLGLAVLIGLAFRLARLRSTTLQLKGWTAVLYASLAMPLLGLVVPTFRAPLLPGKRIEYAREATPVEAGELAKPNGSAFCSGLGPQATPYSPSLPAAKELSQDHSGAVAAYGGFHSARLFESGDGGRAEMNTGALRLGRTAVTTSAAGAGILTTARQTNDGWLFLGAGIYLLVTLILLARVVAGVILGHKLRAAAKSISDESVSTAMRQTSISTQLERLICVAESASISVPVTIGAIHPAVLLPANWVSWDSRKLRAVLAHELSHAYRRDGLTQMLSTLHRCFFWFSPLSWWLHRRLTELAEQASDDSAVQEIHDRSFYAEVLLGFFQSVSSAPGRWLGVSMARGSSRSKAAIRVERILDAPALSPGKGKRIFAAAVLVAIFPLAMAAASVKLVPQSSTPASQVPTANRAKTTKNLAGAEIDSTRSAAPAQSQLAPGGPQDGLEGDVINGVPSEIPGGVDGGIPGGVDGTGPDGIPELVLSGMAGGVPVGIPDGLSVGAAGDVDLDSLQEPATTQAPPAPAPMPSAAIFQSRVAASAGSLLSSAIQDEADQKEKAGHSFKYIILAQDLTIVISGSKHDMEHVKSLRKKLKSDLIWFERDGRAYIVTDPTTVKAAKDLFTSWQTEASSYLSSTWPGQFQGFAALSAKQSEEWKRQAEELARKLFEDGAKHKSELDRELQEMIKDKSKLMSDEASLRAELMDQQAKSLRDQIGSDCKEYVDVLTKLYELEAQIAGGLSADDRAKLDARMAEVKAQIDQLRKANNKGAKNNLGDFQEGIRDWAAQMSAAQADMAKQEAELAKSFAESAARFKLDGKEQMKEMQRKMEEGMREFRQNMKQFKPFKETSAKLKALLDQALKNGLATPEP